MIELDLIETLAFGGVFLMIGYGARRALPALARFNLPAAVVGGLIASLLMLAGYEDGAAPIRFDTALQTPLMIAFFTTVGFGASLSLLKVGGPQVLSFFLLATGFAVLQNIVGIAVAWAFGLDPLFGVLAGSVTLVGGPATGLAFAPLFEQAGVAGAASIAVAVAMAGILCGAIIGSPAATRLIDKHGLAGRGVRRLAPEASRAAAPHSATAASTAAAASSISPVEPVTIVREDLAKGGAETQIAAEDDDESFVVLKCVVALLVCMWAGGWVSEGFRALGITLPAYIGAMLVAALVRNLDDVTGWLRLSHRVMDTIGVVALSLFLVLALMTLRLWELAGLALPLLATLAAQVVLILLAVGTVFRIMGRDYEAAVMSGGFIGFMLGTTANAMAVMRALAERYGPAPRAFLVAPIVGAFFLDFTNALLITACLNLLG